MADDGSPDGTADAVRALMARHPGRVFLLLRKEKGGRGAAVIAAFKRGLADRARLRYLFEMDADFSHHPREIPKFLEKLETCDMVIGSRYIPGGGTSDWGVLRPLLSWMANRYVALVAGIPVKDTTSGYRGYRRAGPGGDGVRPHQDHRLRGPRRDGLPGLDLNGFRLGEVPIHFKNRDRDASKLSAEEIYMALVNFAMLRFRYGIRGPGGARSRRAQTP